jgi:hypothetical protein
MKFLTSNLRITASPLLAKGGLEAFSKTGTDNPFDSWSGKKIINRCSGGTGGVNKYTGNIIQYYFTDFARRGGRFKGGQPCYARFKMKKLRRL